LISRSQPPLRRSSLSASCEVLTMTPERPGPTPLGRMVNCTEPRRTGSPPRMWYDLHHKHSLAPDVWPTSRSRAFPRRGGLLVETGFSDSRVIDAVRVLLIVSSCFQNSNGGGASSTSKSRGGARKRSMTDQCSPPPLRT